MRGLKITAIVMASLLAVMLLMLAYLFLTAEVTVTVVGTQGVPASEQAESFETLKQSLEENTFIGTLYQKPAEWKDASEYVYLQFTLNVRNGCLVPIDMIQIQVVPQPTDILQLGDLQNHALAPKTEGALTATILTPKDSHPVREVLVTYYVWGVSFQLKTLSGQ